MQEILTAALLCNTGLFLTYGSSSILIDALNSSIQSFQAIPSDTAGRIIRGQPPFTQVDGIFYSHLHPDHYDQHANQAFLRRHTGSPAFFPTAETADHGILRAGAFTVEFQYMEHVPCGYPWAKHYVFLISAGGVSVYLTADADPAPDRHLAFLNGRRADYGFWNSIYLSYPQTRRLLKQAAAKTYIYHMPDPEHDTSGICRKAARNLERYPEELRDVTVLTHYPASLELPPQRR